MRVTPESTGPSAEELKRRLGSVMWAQTAPVFDLMAELLAEKAKQKRNGLNAGKVKTGRVQRAITIMVWRHRRQLRAWTPGKRESRALHIQSHIEGAITMGGGSWMGITTPPHWRTIDRVIHSLRM